MFAPQTSSISVDNINIEDDYDEADLTTPKVPRGKRSDLTEKDLDEFTHSSFHLLLLAQEDRLTN